MRVSAKMAIEKMYPLDKLVLQHTMYPQYARFIPASQKKTALYRLGNDFCDAHHLFAILPRSEKEQYLKFCPICAKEDRQNYGETYWHRKHQIRNIMICPRHHCYLEDSSIPAKSELSFTLFPAEIAVDGRNATFTENSVLQQFAEYMERIFDAPWDFDNNVPLSAILYHGLKQTKYLKPSGRSRYTKQLSDDMSLFYSKLGMNEIATINQIQRELLGERFDFSVTCQIGFYIGMSPEELIFSVLTPAQIEQEQSSHYIKNSLPIDWAQYDKETAPAMERLCKEVYYGTASESGRPERVGEKLVYRELGLLGHQLENMPVSKAIFERYKESYPESWARKLIWAYRKLKEERQNSPFFWSDMRRLSGVKKRNFQAIVPYLIKHTDTQTAASLIELVENEK